MSFDIERVEEVEWWKGITLNGVIHYPILNVTYKNTRINSDTGLVLGVSIHVQLKEFDALNTEDQTSERVSLEEMKSRHKIDDTVLKVFERQVAQQLLGTSSEPRIASARSVLYSFGSQKIK